MKHIGLVIVWLLCGVTALPFVQAGDLSIPVSNTGFEISTGSRTPKGWRLETRLKKGNTSGTANKTKHGGGASLYVNNTVPDSVTWVSDPVQLKVGHLYRLRGWVRTKKAFSDPTSRYPTAVPACLTMASFPFTNHSKAVGATRGWTEVQTLFIATKKSDRVRVHLGYNGTATGTAWFDDVTLEKVDDIGEFIPPEGVRWFGPAYRYDDKGWIFVHIEGAPYERGYQYGNLVSGEIVSYAMKLAIRQNSADPKRGWDTIRFMTQAWMLPGYEDEFQTEMKGIADGATNAGAKLFDQKVDLLDIAALNSIIDLGQMRRALPSTANATTGINFLKTEDELKIKYENHKCSAFAATGSATEDNRFVFGQIFMWSGYTGVHWNVITDLQPTEGHRFVYHTFPGGIHSGADFYISQSGLVMGETTVRQTPFDPEGTPQSNRIRKAIQYADSVDEMVEIMTTRNNGQYTNEWPFANYKTDEVGIFLLGTEKHRLWRSKNRDFPGGLTDFYWCNNNNKDMEVRKEYLVNPDNAPYDLVFRPWNRDISFNRFYHEHKGNIDSIAGVNLWASSPVNRSHACDGKITTAEMAEQLVFLAHYGKTTLREKVPGGRLIQDKPGADPHLSLGYFTPSPLFVTEKLNGTKPKGGKIPGTNDDVATKEIDVSNVTDLYSIDKRSLWRGTIYPASTAENWLVSGSSAYWRILDGLPDGDSPGEAEAGSKAVEHMDFELAALNESYLYHTGNEGTISALEAETRYDRYIDYQVPRIKGTIALHQLRLLLGNQAFTKAMDAVHSKYGRKAITTSQFIQEVERSADRTVGPFIRQWLDRKGLPEPEVLIKSRRAGKRWRVKVTVTQPDKPYQMVGVVEIETANKKYRHMMEISGKREKARFRVAEEPVRVVFNQGRDIPAIHDRFYTMPNFLDDFHDTTIVYGTGRQIEANHTMALRWQRTLADSYVEIMVPVRKDAEITKEELSNRDLMVIGSAADNSLLEDLSRKLPFITMKKNYFCFQGTCFTRPDQGIILAAPNPFNPKKKLFLVIANSALQLYKMTGKWHRNIPGWAIFENYEIESRGYHPIPRFSWTGKPAN